MRDNDATTVRPRPPSDSEVDEDLRLDDERTDEPTTVDNDLRTSEDPDLRTDEDLRTDDDGPTDEVVVDERATDERDADAVDDDARPDELGDGELDERPTDVDDELDESTQDSNVLAADVISARPDSVDDDTDETPIVEEASFTDETPSTEETPVTPVPVVAETRVEEPATAATNGGLWAGGDVEAMRERWREVQLRFVDDPELAAREAGDLVDEAAQTLVAAIEARRAELSQWRSTADMRSTSDTSDSVTESTAPETPRAEGETERMRVVVQAYRSFLDEVLRL